MPYTLEIETKKEKYKTIIKELHELKAILEKYTKEDCVGVTLKKIKEKK